MGLIAQLCAKTTASLTSLALTGNVPKPSDSDIQRYEGIMMKDYLSYSNLAEKLKVRSPGRYQFLVMAGKNLSTDPQYIAFLRACDRVAESEQQDSEKHSVMFFCLYPLRAPVAAESA